MTIHNFENSNSIMQVFISELRDKNIQQDAMRLRRNIERVGEIMAYEISKTLTYKMKQIATPLGTKQMNVLDENIVICSVLRAGLPLQQGVLNYFDREESAFISAYRKRKKDSLDFDIVTSYFAAPNLDEKILIITDPMLATGKTLENVYKVLQSHGTPKEIHLVSVIASQSGIENVKKVFPLTTQLWVATIDSALNKKGHIIPGLGDAGDLAYGKKL